MPLSRWSGVGALIALTLVVLLAVPGEARVRADRTGTITAAAAPSAALGGGIAYNLYLPYGCAKGTDRYPVLYLLHGRGDTMQAWTRVKDALDAMIRTRRIPPLIAAMPDARRSEGGSGGV